jgi:hypothetical protein
MQVTKFPPLIHTAFNPAFFEVQDATATDVDIDVNGDIFNCEFINGAARLNLSNIVKRLFADEVVVSASSGIVFFVDKNLFVRYAVDGTGIGGPYFSNAINAVVQIGENSDMTSKQGKFLTNFKRLKKYADFPLSVSALRTEYSTFVEIGSIGSTAGTPNNPHFCVAIPDNAIYVMVQDEHEAETDNRFVDDFPCTDSPFYVRWINQQGGWDYWMFSFRQFISRNIQNQQTFNPNIDNQETAKGFTELINQDGIEQITVGTSGLNENEYEVISKLIYSPKIEFYDKEKDKWFTLIVDKGENEKDTRMSSNSLEFTFNLPTPQLQF